MHTPQPTAASIGWMRFAVLATPILGVTVFSKFTIPPLGAQGLDLSLFFLLLAILTGLSMGFIRLDSGRLTLYVVMIGLLGLIQSLQPDTFSIPSMLLLAGLHFPYVFSLERPGDGERMLQFFIEVVTLCAVLGIGQYGLQFALSHKVLFPIESFFPASFTVQHYNAQAAISYGSSVYRPNGVFMLEPSFFSQVLAVAFIAELCTRTRVLRLALFAVALLVSFSGTGVLVLAICLPLYLATRRRWGLLLAGAAALVAVAALHAVLPWGHLFSRLNEFSSTRSSGFARFVGGFYLFDQYLWANPWRTLFGYGAGAFADYAPHARVAVAEMALFKIVFEFGLLGALLYAGFVFGCLYPSRAPRLLTVAVAITYCLNGLYASLAHGLALGLILWCPVASRAPSSASAAPAPTPAHAPPPREYAT